MNRRHFLRSAAALVAGACLARPGYADDAPKENAAVPGSTAFACDLYGQLRRQAGNLFFAPLSVSAALTMTSAGAAGATLDEMAKVLHLAADRDAAHADAAALVKSLTAAAAKAGNELRVANALWTQKGFPFKPAFLATLKDAYDAAPQEVDFADAEAARKRINEWVEQQTKDKIKDLFPQGTIDPMTRLTLANAVYFKGDWLRAFDPKATADAPFAALGGSVKVPMMRQTNGFPYAEGDGWQALGLNYAGEALQMVVVLPRAADGLDALEAKLTPAALDGYAKALKGTRVAVGLPRFKLEGQFGLKKTLEALGMVQAFGRADFSRMTSATEDLHVQAVVHKSYIDVNERGSEAAAATGVVVGARSVAVRPKDFVADRPFLFLIRDKSSGAVLFLGRVARP